MKCPKCNKEMKEIEKFITNNGLKGNDYKEYLRTRYLCEQDDVWLSIEIPNQST